MVSPMNLMEAHQGVTHIIRARRVRTPRRTTRYSNANVCLAALGAALTFAACAAASRGTATARGTPATPQSVALELRASDGVASLDAFSIGEPYTIDPRKLSFRARAYRDHGASPVPLAVTLGTPQSVPSNGVHPEAGLRTYTMTAVFPKSPGPPGMYELEVTAAPGFAETGDGAALPLRDWSRPSAPWRVFMWWPNTGDGDASLQHAQKRFAGHDVFGYGGIVISCPQWFNAYGSRTPVRVRDVVRDTGRIEELWTGATVHGGDEMAPHFFAVAPLRLLVAKPADQPLGVGGSSGTSSSTARCPALALADWQLDATLSLEPPPPLPKLDGDYPQLRKGMTKDEVAWRFGYPRTFDDAVAFQRADRWVYDGNPFNSFWIAFRNGRAVAFSGSRSMP